MSAQVPPSILPPWVPGTGLVRASATPPSSPYLSPSSGEEDKEKNVRQPTDSTGKYLLGSQDPSVWLKSDAPSVDAIGRPQSPSSPTPMCGKKTHESPEHNSSSEENLSGETIEQIGTRLKRRLNAEILRSSQAIYSFGNIY